MFLFLFLSINYHLNFTINIHGHKIENQISIEDEIAEINSNTSQVKSSSLAILATSHAGNEDGVECYGEYQHRWFGGLLRRWHFYWSLLVNGMEIPFENISNLQWVANGTEGVVYKAMLNGKTVAVKKVQDYKGTDINYLLQLYHPNIVSFIGLSTRKPDYYIVMEYCPYGTLSHILGRGQSFPPTVVADWAKQIACGMNYLHSHKIIHRDLKSLNILFGNNHVVKITDFGTSRVWNQKSAEMSLAGTCSWIAPEMIRNDPCSSKVDVWSYGVVLWEMLTCEIPFKQYESCAIMLGVGSGTCKLPIPESCPHGFKLLMKQCWDVTPGNRPSFKQILLHLDIIIVELFSTTEETYFDTLAKIEKLVQEGIEARHNSIADVEEELLQNYVEELEYAEVVRREYEKKLINVTNLHLQVNDRLKQLDEREHELKQREEEFKNKMLLNNSNQQKLSDLDESELKQQEQVEDNQLHESNSDCEQIVATSSAKKRPPRRRPLFFCF